MTARSTGTEKVIVCLTGGSVVGSAICELLAARFGAVRTELEPDDGADLVVTYIDGGRPDSELKRVGGLAARSPVLVIGPLESAAEALRAGAAGYATPHTPNEEFHALVAAALEGRIGLSQEVLEHLIHGRDPIGGLSAAALTARHRRIILALASGMSLTAIGVLLGVSRQAVSQTVERLARRAGVEGAEALVRYVEDHGLLAGDA